MSEPDITQHAPVEQHAWRRAMNAFGPVLGLVGVYFLFVYIGPDSFFAGRTVQTIARQTAIVGTAALGMTLVIIAGGIDLSVGSVVAFSSVVVAWCLRECFGEIENVPQTAAWYQQYLYTFGFALAGVVAGALCGLVSGMLITGLRVVPFIVTLGMMLVVRGVGKGLAHQEKIMAPGSWLNEMLATSGREMAWSTPVTVFVVISWIVMGLAVLFASVYSLAKLSRPERESPLPVSRSAKPVAAVVWVLAAAGAIFLAAEPLAGLWFAWLDMEGVVQKVLLAVAGLAVAAVVVGGGTVLFRRACRVGGQWSATPNLLLLTLVGLIYMGAFAACAWLTRPWIRATYAGLEGSRAALFAVGMVATALVLLTAGVILLKLLWSVVSKWRFGPNAVFFVRSISTVVVGVLWYGGAGWLFWHTYTWPAGVWMLAVLALLVAGVLRYTRFGRHVFAVGSNELTARLCGVPVEKIKILVFMLGGLFAGLAGFMQFSRLNVGDPTVAIGLELDVIAAVVIGGGSLSGGQGSILGTIVGALIMGVIRSGCSQMGLEDWVQQAITGAIIIIAVALDRLRHRRAT